MSGVAGSATLRLDGFVWDRLVRAMRRAVAVGALVLLGLAALPPMAAARVQHLTLEGDAAGSGVPTPPGSGQVLLSIDYLVKREDGHKRLIPKRVTSFNYLFVPVSCDQGTSLASFEVSGFGGASGIKITRKRFSLQYTAKWGDAIQSTVQLAGKKMWQERTKWRGRGSKPAGKKFSWKRASGTFNVLDWDDLRFGGSTNCTTNAPRSWSVHQCRATSDDPAFLPQCRFGGGT